MANLTFADIFQEYYSIFRGQATSIPTFTTNPREYLYGIRLANNAIKKWERADGTLWAELQDTLQRQNITIAPAQTKTITSGTTEYATPSNMRKPPAKVSFFNGSSQTWIPAIHITDLQEYIELAGVVTFVGSANTGYTMIVGQPLATAYDAMSIDYVYTKKASLFTTALDPAASIPEMSDPNFIIQDMLATRYSNSRNGFGYKVAKSEATTALRNMRMENDSGTYGTINVLKGASGWGKSSNVGQDIKL